MTRAPGMKFAFGVLLTLCAGACGGTSPPAAPHAAAPVAPAPSAPSAPTASNYAPTGQPLAALPAMSERQHLLLCGEPAAESGGLSLARAERAAADDDANVTALLAELGNVSDAKCRDAVDGLRNAVQLQRGSSETLCNLRAARGIGQGGETLRDSAGSLLAGIDARLAPFDEPGSKGCARLADALKADLAKFLEQRNELCAETPADRALLECRDDARAKSFCEARAHGHEPSREAVETVQHCLR